MAGIDERKVTSKKVSPKAMIINKGSTSIRTAGNSTKPGCKVGSGMQTSGRYRIERYRVAKQTELHHRMLLQEDKDIDKAVRNLRKYIVN